MLGFCLSLHAFGQETDNYFKRYSLEEGLTNPIVHSIYQDKKGFMWFSNKSSIDRFDGYSFSSLTIPGNDSLKIEFFACIHIDDDGYRYIGTERHGMLVISSDSKSLEVFNSDGQEGLTNNYVDPIYEDSKGRIWVGTYGGGVHQFNKETRTFTPYVHSAEDELTTVGKMIYKIKEGPNGHLWVGTDGGGLHVIDPESGNIKRYIHDPNDPFSIPGNYVFDLDFDHYGKLWLATYQAGLSYLDLESQRFYSYPLNSGNENEKFIASLKVTPDGEIWAGYENDGLKYINPINNTLIEYRHSESDELSISSNTVDALHLDLEGNIWTKNRGSGINILPNRSTPFKKIEHNPGLPNSISSSDISKVLVDQYGNTWVAHRNKGIDRMDHRTNRIINFSKSNLNRYRIPDDAIEDIELDNNGNLWVGTRYGGVVEIDINSLDVKHYPHSKYPINGPGNNWIFDILIGSDENIWVCSHNGFSVIDKNTKQFSHFESDKDKEDWFEGVSIYKMLQDSNNDIWIEVDKNDFYKLDISSNAFTKSYLENSIQYSYKDQYGYYLNGNIYSINLISNDTIVYPFENDLFVHGIYQTNQDQLWVSSNNGLWLYDLNTTEYRNFNNGDGLLSNQLEEYIHYSTLNNQLYIITEEGINYIDPNELSTNQIVPSIHISDLKYFDSKSESSDALSYNNITDASKIKFPYHINFLEFQLAALSYSKVDKNEYRYRIKGLGNQWFDLGTKNNITLTNLSPGHYTLDVQGSNGDGIWNEEGRQLEIEITPPWWQSSWAYLTYLLLVLLGIWTFIRSRTRIHKQRLAEERKVVERLKEVDRLKDQFLANTSHELRTPLNGIIGLSESLKDGVAGNLSTKAKENLEMIISSGKRLSNLVNDILDFSKLKNHELTLRLAPVDLKAAVDIVVAMSESLAKDKNLKITNNISSDLPLAQADEDRIQQILYNLIGNAIKFTNKGSIDVLCEKQNNELKTTIRDTGIGIAKENFEKIFRSFDQVDGDTSREFGGTGLGLTVTKQLVEQHGGTISIDSELGSGTSVSFTLPISKTSRLDFTSSKGQQISVSKIQSDSSESIVVTETNIAKEHQFNILVVDDEPVNRQVLRNHLDVAGYNVFEAANGNAALEIIKEGLVANLVLLDIMMPGMSGYQVAESLRKDYTPSEMPIIMLTAKNRINDLVTGFNIGANDYLSKPFLKDELLSRIQIHLNLHQMHRETSKFVPEAFIKAIGRSSITEVELGDYTEKNVSVLFTDIRGYTGLSENMTPKENFDFVRSYVSQMGPIIQESQGFVNQYLGDGIMAIFDQSSVGALEAAIRMQHQIYDINIGRKALDIKPIRVGMGLATGPLIMGIIGDHKRKDPTTIATTVNIASRIEGLTKYYGANILLDRASINKLPKDHKYNLRDIGKAQVKGQEVPIDIYECIDGDQPHIKKLKLESLEEFETALSNFIAGEFEKSKEQFFSILKKNSEDSVAEYFYERSLVYFKNGVQKNWFGVEKLEYK